MIDRLHTAPAVPSAARRSGSQHEGIPVVPEPLIRQFDVPGPRYTSYPPVPAWDPTFGAGEYAAALGRTPADDDMALYAHFPFCAKRCLYCGCNVVVSTREAKMAAYLDDLARDVALVAEAVGFGRQVREMHWGGGTPNLLTPAQTERALRLITNVFTFTDGAELSVEADPRAVTPGQLALYRALGFSRVSFGVQDLDESVQRAIGRMQPLAMVRDVVSQALAVGFTGINLDLIYGLPRQTTQSIDATLDAVIGLDPNRIACFAYAHVPSQRPHQRAIPEEALPNGVERVALFRHVVERLTDAGYAWIGLDHFAREDDALAVAQREGRLHRNFMGYTPYPARHLVGVGMSAISEVNGYLAQNAAQLAPWADAVRAGTLPVVRGHALTPDDERRGAIIRQILCNLELPLSMVPPEMTDALDALRAHEATGLVTVEPDRVKVTTLGRFFLRNLCMPFDAYLPTRPGERAYSRTM